MRHTKTVEEIKEHRSVEKYEETDNYHEFHLNPYGNCSVIGDITKHKHGNFGVQDNNIIARIKK
jgi:hypothetical protein